MNSHGSRNKVFVRKLYENLMAAYGAQGWWPVLERTGTGEIVSVYHTGDYDYPKTDGQRFEICVGAILTQNTSWNQALKALVNLWERELLTPKTLLAESRENVAEVIRPAGYFNAKAKKLMLFSEFFLANGSFVPSREKLLGQWGVGPETADSMLLYAWNEPAFVIDAYTRRILAHAKILSLEGSYDDAKAIFESSLPKDVRVFQEFHALIVEHAKRHYSRKPHGIYDKLLPDC